MDATETQPGRAPLKDRELFDEMWRASWRATEAALAAGHRRDDQIVKDSAWSAAQQVYQRERPGEAPLTRHPLPNEPVPDVVQERMEREPVVPVPMFTGDEFERMDDPDNDRTPWD